MLFPLRNHVEKLSIHSIGSNCKVVLFLLDHFDDLGTSEQLLVTANTRSDGESGVEHGTRKTEHGNTETRDTEHGHGTRNTEHGTRTILGPAGG
eukprot:3372161-Prymnesium_polylepis.1